MKFADQTGITELITLTKTALKPLEAFKNSVTDVSGIVKSNGSGGFSAAVAGTDYAAASHTHDYLPLSGGTLTGNLTGKYITGTWLQTTATGDKAGNFATIDGQGWIYYRTPAEARVDIGALATTDITEYTETEIETLWNAAKLLISFTITDTLELGVYPTGTFSAEEGMTFGEWLASSYNTAHVQYSYEHETYGTLTCSVSQDTVLKDGMNIGWNV